jgi:endonuclease YncB( thermonuclease family)
MRFQTKLALAIIASNFLPPEGEAQRNRTNFGVRTPPGSPAETAWPNQRVSRSGAPGVFNCRVAYVTDGDTFRCTSGVRVRLSSIDAPEMPGSCRPGRHCTPGDPFAAKATLMGMIAGRTVRCDPVGKTYNRIAAWCSIGGRDLSCAMVQSGHAIRRYGRRRRVCG